jgi:hypothetical protein
LLTGHALMIDLSAMGRGAVRKYWLAQDFIASVARDDIRQVEFAGGDIHRLIVSWNSGARVCVNRGAADWVVEGHTLPQFGYWAKNGAIESSIERFGAAIAEQARSPGKYYCNSRVFAPTAPLAITPRVERLEYLGGRQFRLVVNWEAQRPAPRDNVVFYHFSRPTPGRRALTEFVAGGSPATPTTQWQGRVVTGENWTIAIPPELPLGDYEILVGLHDGKNRGSRERLLGDEDARRRYRVGKLVVEGNRAAEVTALRFEPPPQPYVPSTRWLANVAPVDFGVARTTGAFRAAVAADHVVVTPLPDGADFELELRLAELVGRAVKVRTIEAVDAQGTARAEMKFSERDGAVGFSVVRTDFAYRVNFR